MTPRRRNDYNEIINAVRVLSTEYQYNVVQDQWYLRLANNATKEVTAKDVKAAIRHLAMEAYAVDDHTPAGKTWMDRVYSEACISPEATVLMWIGEALELNAFREMRGCDLHAVWAVDHGIYDSPAPFSYYKTSPAAYTATYKAQARRFYDVLEREGERYDIRRLTSTSVPPGVKFSGCTLRPPHQVPATIGAIE